jgi:hypothetical protein
LHGAGAWLLCPGAGPAEGDLAATDACFPDWLKQLLEELRGAPHTPVGVCVSRALGMRDHVTSKDGGIRDQGMGGARLAACEVELLRRWLVEDEPAATRLAALMSRLRELERGDDEFRRALEIEKLDALKELAYGASHEINNPLANISARAQTLLRDERDPRRRRMLSSIHSQAMRAHEMIADLMLFARPPKLVPKTVDLVRLVDDVVAELSEDAVRREATIERLGTRGPVMVQADDVQLGVVLRAMGTNALEAIRGEGRIQLEVRVERSDDQTCWARIIVTDDGPGIPPRVRRHLFDPFFSGREAGRGLGFGLSKCWRIVTDHGGRIDVESPITGGAIFTVSLPMDRRP